MPGGPPQSPAAPQAEQWTCRASSRDKLRGRGAPPLAGSRGRAPWAGSQGPQAPVGSGAKPRTCTVFLVARALAAAALALAGVGAGACARKDVPERRFYSQQIQPIFDSFCVGNTSPCHKIDPGTGTALGNLDLTSFDAVRKRPDVLREYGAYALPVLLLKSIPEDKVLIPYNGKLYASEIRHAGGKPLSPNSDAFYELRRWLDNGATAEGLPPPSKEGKGQGDCSRILPPDVGEPPVDRAQAAYGSYLLHVEPLLQKSCAYGTCHSSPQSDLVITCGLDEAQRDSNFRRVAGFVAAPPANVEESELLLRPLEPQAGGVNHTGGVFFPSRDDLTWKKLRDFALAVQQSPPPGPRRSSGEAFFGEQVMPVLLRRGCAFEACHSPSGFNDFRLRPGAPGFLSRFALRRNYETTLREFVSLDTDDVRQSRLVKKNLFLPAAGGVGIAHRGGSLLESPRQDTRLPCPTPFDPATASAFCVIKEWHRIERQDHAMDVSPLGRGQVVPVAFVARPADPDGPLEFDTFRGGADLKLADAQLGDGGRIERVTNVRSALVPCAGLAGRTDVDVRGPEWSYDGHELVFAARVAEGGGLDLWLLERDGATCRRLTNDNGRSAGPVRVHNLDPVFAPDDSLVFASTRGGTLTLKRLLPGADLFRVGADLDFGKVEQMTWLLNSELSAAFMQNGQLAFTAEKASPGFYQLSGRRINWDLTDYHPLLAQRAQSDDTFGKVRPSVDYKQATEIREGLDRNFVLILSNPGETGSGGALATFNRSLGPFEAGRNEETFLRALDIVDPAAHGKAGTQGVYRSPYPLPNGELLASYSAGDPRASPARYDLVAVDPVTRGRRPLLPGGALSFVEAALGAKRSSRLLFTNVPQLVFGGHGGAGETATVHFPDAPLLATLLGANLRRGRNVAALDRAVALKVYEPRPPASMSAGAGALQGPERVFAERRPLGQAALEADRSLKVRLPAKKPLVLELVDKDGAAVFTMQEEHQLGPGEAIAPGVPRKLFNAVCGGCHGSLSGKEIDIAVTPDALTGASVSASRDAPPKSLQ